jgi:hypothetical protein
LTGLQQLCEEFGFSDFGAKLSKISERKEDSQGRQLGSPLAGVRSAELNQSFQFIANGAVIELDFAEAAALFPAVREQLSVDGCALQFFLKDSGIESADIRSLRLFHSGESNSIGGSQVLQSHFLGKVNFERQFPDCSKLDIRQNLSDFANERGIDFECADV